MAGFFALIFHSSNPHFPMKKPLSPLARARGMALLPTLIIIALISIVVVLFFNLSTVNLRSSSSHTAVMELGSLRDLAVNSAIGQLRQGSTETNAVWISQPGALRTFVANSGTPSRVYKLYSSREMVVNAATLGDGAARNLENDIPTNWDQMPEVYADLNVPAFDGEGNITFPVIDPRAMDSPNPVYPGSTTPEGFRYSASLASSGTPVTGVRLPGGSDATQQRVPMPVQWLYILADGSLGVLDAATREFVPFTGQQDASQDNPIVGRAAFWTDDESGKININTAAEGIHWDTPRVATDTDEDYAIQTPVRNEVQRFGGHPATTALSTIFYPGQRLLPMTAQGKDRLELIYNLAPRVSTKDSDGALAGILGQTPTAPNLNPIAFDSDPLYNTVDEYIMKAPGTAPVATRVLNPIFAADPERVNRLRFLLTADSRSPEITASGLPKVSLWPVHLRPEDNQGFRTSFDNVSAFCATLGGKPYHFRRSGAASNMDDFSNYYNGPEKDPFGIGLISNNYLAQYLVEQAKNRRQGYAKSLAEKYDDTWGTPDTNPFNIGSGILAFMEYIRQTNMFDTTYSTRDVTPRVPVKAYAQASNNWIGTDTIGQVAAVDMTYYGEPFNTANKILKNEKTVGEKVWTTGVGREYTVSEFGLVFILAAEHKLDGSKHNQPLADLLKLPRGTKAIQAAPIFEGFCPSQGFSMIAPSSSAKADWLDLIQISTAQWGARYPGGAIIEGAPEPRTQEQGEVPAGDVWLPTRERTLPAWRRWGRIVHNVSHLQYLTQIKPLGTPQSGRNTSGNWWVGWGGSGGYWMYADSNLNNHAQVASIGTDKDLDLPEHNFPTHYSRGYFLVPSIATEMTVLSTRTGTNVERCIEIKVGNQRDGDFGSRRLLVEIPPNMIVPVPAAPNQLRPTFGQRYEEARYYTGNRFARPEVIDRQDTVRTWVVRHGDHRLPYLRLREGGAEAGIKPERRLFVPHPAWDPAGSNAAAAKAIKQIHAFVKSGGERHVIGSAGVGPTFGSPTEPSNLVEDATYALAVRPDFPVAPDSAVFRANVPGSYPYSVNPTDTRDWDNGAGIAPDGAYWNKPDDLARRYDGNIPPYFSKRPWDGITINPNTPVANETTAPNQVMPSAVMFGSIPSAPSSGLQWTTYLFRPNITPGGHLGSKNHSTKGTMPGAPPDHTLLDLFWMPVVQPYAISEPFSTAGKINMNYRIVPFTHITRATGLHAVLKSEKVLAIPTGAGTTYKTYASPSLNPEYRHFVDPTPTLLQWESKFNAGEFFMNPSEICEQFLVPEGQSIAGTTGTMIRSQMETFWSRHKLTGDNSLERPYANLYPRLTTRSNTYRVHYLVQALTKARSTNPRTFIPDKDSVSGETQGDALVERSIDPNDPALSGPDYDYLNKARTNALSTTKSLDTLYTWRIRHYRHFMR
jgi:uncharacterized protein (TIGR02600 family)